jgi:hypothetical protein
MWGSSVGCTRLTGVDRFERVGEVGQRGANAFGEAEVGVGLKMARRPAVVGGLGRVPRA